MTAIENELLLGAELRTPLQHLVRRVHGALHESGIHDLRPAHFTVFQVIGDAGLRSTELAERAGMTKQSMGALIEYLEARGYLERVNDPRDGRARIVRLTDRGWKIVGIARRSIIELEREWQAALGSRRYDAFRASLTRLNAAMAVE